MLYEMSFLKVQFLAMANLKLVWLCSFGLTKSFKYLIKGAFCFSFLHKLQN